VPATRGRNFHEALEQRLSRMVELPPILTQRNGVIRHERSAKQIDRAKHQADDCGAGVEESSHEAADGKSLSLRVHDDRMQRRARRIGDRQKKRVSQSREVKV